MKDYWWPQQAVNTEMELLSLLSPSLRSVCRYPFYIKLFFFFLDKACIELARTGPELIRHRFRLLRNFPWCTECVLYCTPLLLDSYRPIINACGCMNCSSSWMVAWLTTAILRDLFIITCLSPPVCPSPSRKGCFSASTLAPRRGWVTVNSNSTIITALKKEHVLFLSFLGVVNFVGAACHAVQMQMKPRRDFEAAARKHSSVRQVVAPLLWCSSSRAPSLSCECWAQ